MAKPVVSGPNLSGWYSRATVTWNWLAMGGTLDPARCPATTTDLESADLTGASLASANLAGADLAGATLNRTDLAGVKWSNTTCPNGTNSNDEGGSCVFAPTADPTIGGVAKNGWYLKATVTWHWSSPSAATDPTRCPPTTTSAVQGKPAHITATCYDAQDVATKASVAVNIENTGPKVAVTGVTAGHVYALGQVPAAACRTTDTLSGVAKAAKISVSTTGSRGVGKFTATCAGAVNKAGLAQAAPVKVTYSVAYGLSAFLAPKNKAAVAKSTHSFLVTFKLAGISASQAAKLAAAGRVRVTLSGPGISAVTVTAAWHAGTGTFTARIPIPAKAKTDVSYALAVRENLGAGLVTAPPAGKAPNPESISFR